MAVDPIIDGLVKRLRSIECRPGDLNYTVCRVVLESLRPNTGWDYHSLSSAVSVLKDAAVEIERRLLGPYEDTGIEKNGDLHCFNEKFATQKPVQALDIQPGGCCQPFIDPVYGDVSSAPPVADAACDVPIAEALTDEQFDATEAQREADRVSRFNKMRKNLEEESIFAENLRRAKANLPDMTLTEAQKYLDEIRATGERG
jgi:hypothetical protein